MVNLSLLVKWKWRLINGGNALWKEVLVEKYGTSCVGLVVEEDYVWLVHTSRWWRDMVGLDESNWFNSELSRKVGNGANTKFWEVAWRGDFAFRHKYPRLLSLSNQKEACVGDLGDFNTTETNWLFSWRRPLFVWENELLMELLEDLEGFRGFLEEDVWWWRLEDNGGFTVKSMYKKLEGLMLEECSISEEQGSMFTHIWKSSTPAKVAAFSWKLLHDRIPTKFNLSHRQILPPESSLTCFV